MPEAGWDLGFCKKTHDVHAHTTFTRTRNFGLRVLQSGVYGWGGGGGGWIGKVEDVEEEEERKEGGRLLDFSFFFVSLLLTTRSCLVP